MHFLEIVLKCVELFLQGVSKDIRTIHKFHSDAFDQFTVEIAIEKAPSCLTLCLETVFSKN